MSAKFTPGPEINRRWTVENDTGAELTVRAPNGFAVELDANSYDPRERFAYFAIRQLQQDIAAAHAVLRELAECSQYWSEYDVPLGIHDRIAAALAKAVAK